MITCGKDLDYMKSVISIGNQDFVSIRKTTAFILIRLILSGMVGKSG